MSVHSHRPVKHHPSDVGKCFKVLYQMFMFLVTSKVDVCSCKGQEYIVIIYDSLGSTVYDRTEPYTLWFQQYISKNREVVTPCWHLEVAPRFPIRSNNHFIYPCQSKSKLSVRDSPLFPATEKQNKQQLYLAAIYQMKRRERGPVNGLNEGSRHLALQPDPHQRIQVAVMGSRFLLGEWQADDDNAIWRASDRPERSLAACE